MFFWNSLAFLMIQQMLAIWSLVPLPSLRTVSNLGKDYIKAVWDCHPAYLTYMQSTLCKMPGWMNHKLESNLPGEINNLRYADDTTLITESKEELKSLLIKVKEESERDSLTLKKLRSWHLVPSLHDKQKEEKWKQWQILFSWAPKSLWTMTTAMKLNDAWS